MWTLKIITESKILINSNGRKKLKTVEVREETAYLPETLAPDKPVIMDVDKGHMLGYNIAK